MGISGARLALVVFATVCPVVATECLGEVPRALPLLELNLLADAQGVGDELGKSMAYREPFLMAGAWGASSDGVTHHGAAQAWRYTPNGWIAESFLLASERSAEDRFGVSVALAAPTLLPATNVAAAIGADGTEVNGVIDAGAVHVYRRKSMLKWTPETILVASDPQANARFGRAVAMDGDLIAVGAPQRNGFRGAVYLYRLQATAPGEHAWFQEAILIANDAFAGDGLGISVDVVGNRVVAGAWGKDAGSSVNHGAIYVFDRQGSTWVQSAKLMATNSQSLDELGRTVAIDRVGDTIVAGNSPTLSNGLSKALVFERNGSFWTQTATLTAPQLQVGDGFASALSINDDRILVGAPSRKVDGKALRGSAFIFGRDEFGVWALQSELLDPNGLPGDSLGSSAVLQGEAAVLGARGFDLPFIANAGTAMIFWVRDCDLNDSFGLCNPPPGDLDLDGYVDGCDLAMLLCQWGPEMTNPLADINDDGEVGGDDLAILLGQWTGCP